jgi:hypothetical protein
MYIKIPDWAIIGPNPFERGSKFRCITTISEFHARLPDNLSLINLMGSKAEAKLRRWVWKNSDLQFIKASELY